MTDNSQHISDHPVRRVGYEGRLFELQRKGALGPGMAETISIGETIRTFRDEPDILRYARAPHKPGAAGHVNDFYASVYGLRWIEITIEPITTYCILEVLNR